MNVDPLIAGVIVTGMAALQGWTLHELVGLKVQVATLIQRLSDLDCQKARRECKE